MLTNWVVLDYILPFYLCIYLVTRYIMKTHNHLIHKRKRDHSSHSNLNLFLILLNKCPVSYSTNVLSSKCLKTDRLYFIFCLVRWSLNYSNVHFVKKPVYIVYVFYICCHFDFFIPTKFSWCCQLDFFFYLKKLIIL
jgi:hypothetical protein